MNALREYRDSLGISQAKLAEMWGLSLSFIAKIEIGVKQFSPEQAVKIEKKTKRALKREQLRPDIFAP
jgi:predicted transcriptional regulator